MAAGHADPQMHPAGADAQAVFTTVSAGCYFLDLIEMGADHFIFHMSFDIFHLPFEKDLSQFPRVSI